MCVCVEQNASSGMGPSTAPGGKGTALQTGFCFWYMRRGKGANNNNTNNTSGNNSKEGEDDTIHKSEDEGSTTTGSNVVHPYENSIKLIATISTVEEFWSCYDYLVRPNALPTTTDYHFFREGIKPTWEDPNNARGGKWIVRLKKGLASRYWEEVILALMGGQLSQQVCGAVVSIRYSEDIVSVWNRNAHDNTDNHRLRDSIKRILQLPPHVHMEYKPHQASLADKSSFRNTQVWKSSKESNNNNNANNPNNPNNTPNNTNTTPSTIRRSGSWGERDNSTGKPKRDMERSWR